MYVERVGSGDVSIVLHGFAGSGPEMLELARRLPGRKLIPDLPGHGRSSTLRDPGAYGMRSVVADLVNLLEEEAVEQADIVGYSMGGRIALGLAAMAPHRVRSVVAIGARAGIADDAERQARKAADEELAGDIETRGADWFAAEWVSRPLYDTQRRLGEAHLEQVLERRRRVDAVGVALSLREMGAGAQPVFIDELAASNVPVYLVVGELDARFAAVADEISQVVATARVVVVPGAGHATHVEALDATVATIIGAWEGV